MTFVSTMRSTAKPLGQILLVLSGTVPGRRTTKPSEPELAARRELLGQHLTRELLGRDTPLGGGTADTLGQVVRKLDRDPGHRFQNAEPLRLAVG
jgi:hypothetical protein